MSLRFLVIDDTDQDRHLVARMLQRHFDGAHVVPVGDPEGLAAALREPAFDLVVTDYRLRWTDGLAVLRAAKAAWPACPVVMFTSTGNEEVAVAGMKAGLDDYVIKGPAQYLSLATASRAAIERAAARRRAIEAERERDRLVAALSRALDSRDRFLQVASHELKNPLNGLVLQIETLIRDPDRGAGSKLEGRLRRAGEHVHHLVGVIERLIEYAHITSGPLEVDLEPVDLVSVAHAALARARSELRRSGCPASVVAPEPVPGRWDRRRLEQAVLALVSNAAKFGAGQRVTVTVRRTDSEARLEVRDAGIGIARADQERIFGAFERAVSENNYAGFGLGLSIAQELVASMHGRIDVSSEPGRGAAFTVVLPLDPEATRREAAA